MQILNILKLYLIQLKLFDKCQIKEIDKCYFSKWYLYCLPNLYLFIFTITIYLN